MANPYEQFVNAEPDLNALEQEHGLPGGLLSAIQTAEGSGDTAVSPKGARGRFQFMPATAKRFGLDDPNNPAQSAAAAARYMKWAKDTYKTDDPKVLAAEYNGGPAAARAVLAGKSPPALETRNYVDKVAGLVGVSDAAASQKTAAVNPYTQFLEQPAAEQPAKQPTPQRRATDTSPFSDYSSPFVNPATEALANMATGAVGKVAGDVAGLGAIPAHALGLANKLPTDVQQQVQEALTYQPRTTQGQKIAQYNPLALIGQAVGKVADVTGEALAPKDYPNLGPGIAEGIKQLPMILGGPATEAAAPVLRGGAETLMRSSLKPPLGTPQARQAATQAVNTLLEEGINVSRGGMQTLTDRIGDLNSRITNLIQSSPAMIDRDLVASRLHDTVNRFASQVNPMTDLASIQRAWREFQNTWPQQIPVQVAQELKQGTYRNLSGKYLGELRSADIESQKALARGLKEEIASAVPEVRPLNEQESRYLTALPLVERRVLQDANRNPVGLGVLSTNPSHLALWMADKSALFKSLVARMLNTGSQFAETMAPAGGVAGAMTNEPQQRRQ